MEFVHVKATAQEGDVNSKASCWRTGRPGVDASPFHNCTDNKPVCPPPGSLCLGILEGRFYATEPEAGGKVISFTKPAVTKCLDRAGRAVLWALTSLEVLCDFISHWYRIAPKCNVTVSTDARE